MLQQHQNGEKVIYDTLQGGQKIHLCSNKWGRLIIILLKHLHVANMYTPGNKLPIKMAAKSGFPILDHPVCKHAKKS